LPELPEVETIRRRLAASLSGLIVRRLDVVDATVSLQSEAELRTLVVACAACGGAASISFSTLVQRY
jgi:formamidopyrimidine-DNA glycosylase